MTKQELFINALEKMGYKPTVDEEGDIMFRHQLKHLFVVGIMKDEPFVNIVLPQFHLIERGKELAVLAACNKLSRDTKLVKVCIDQTHKYVSASCEFFYTNEESIENNLKHSINILSIIRTAFSNELRELT